uniref:Uncharacterized protein n=1 Tax=Candidatus Methanomethylicus mesodigestus TaxID=1867258 RepID=A0A7C3F108_9CREN
MEGYNRSPKGWQFASDGIGNALVLGPHEGYRLKVMALSPTESIGLGAKVEDNEELKGILGEGRHFGFRTISKEDLLSLVRSLKHEEDLMVRQSTIDALLKQDPLPTWRLQPPGLGAIVSGPYAYRPDLRSISSLQSKLDEKLAAEVDALLRKRSPMRASMFR